MNKYLQLCGADSALRDKEQCILNSQNSALRAHSLHLHNFPKKAAAAAAGPTRQEERDGLSFTAAVLVPRDWEIRVLAALGWLLFVLLALRGVFGDPVKCCSFLWGVESSERLFQVALNLRDEYSPPLSPKYPRLFSSAASDLIPRYPPISAAPTFLTWM